MGRRIKWKTDEARQKAILVSKAKWRVKNNDKLVEYRQLPKVRRQNVINQWRLAGTRGDLDNIYDNRYITATHCEWCNIPFLKSKNRQLEHNHYSGEIRGVVCNKLADWKDRKFLDCLWELKYMYNVVANAQTEYFEDEGQE